jgi:regulatory protein
MTRLSRRGGSVAPERSADPEAAREAALRLLERTRRTRSDLARRLRDKGFAPLVIESVLDRLAGVGLVDDAEYARAWLAGRLGRRPAGARTLETELRGRGVSSEDIASARGRLDEEQGATDEVAVARKVVAQAERRYQSLEPRVRRQRLWALLARKGFDGDTIEAALREPTLGEE